MGEMGGGRVRPLAGRGWIWTWGVEFRVVAGAESKAGMLGALV